MPPASHRRAVGSFYTPDWVARWMVSQAFRHCETAAKPRILDPACGDGAFLVATLEWLPTQLPADISSVPARLTLVRDHLYGVDADVVAITALRQRVRKWIGDVGTDSSEVDSVLETNFVCGDALIGPDWSTASTTEPDSPQTNAPVEEQQPSPVDWAATFPDVAKDGGFDIVIGNPPYLRERSAKADFDRVAQSSLGRRWRTARMDFWHYFLHRSLNLLKPNGRLIFIVNSYWLQSTAAAPVRSRLAIETTLDEIVQFGNLKLFPKVSGRHMIFRLRRTLDPDAKCRITDLSRTKQVEIESALQQLNESPWKNTTITFATQSELWGNAGPVATAGRRPDHSADSAIPLAESFEVRQGLAENPPFVTRSAATLLNVPELQGSGVFVLNDQELASMNLSSKERSLLRPYYPVSSIGRFHVPPDPALQILYLTKKTAPSLESFPAIERHLKRFRPILERRREAVRGLIAWWHLHWPREERLFTSPRILCVQMGHEPQFAFAEHPTFVGFSLHVIVPNSGIVRPPISLPALTGLLNSTRAKDWFERHAKRRGAHLDISGTVLKQFPLPKHIDPVLESELTDHVTGWPTNGGDESSANRRLDFLVEQIYRE